MYVCMHIYMYVSKLRHQNCTKTSLVFANDAGGNLKT